MSTCRILAATVRAICAASAALAQITLPQLELHRPVTRGIRAGEVHRYTVEAPTGALVRGVVRQDGTSVNIRGFFPDGSKIRSFAGPDKGARRFRFVIEIPGPYQLEITSLAKSDGRYTLTIEEIQPLTERLKIEIPEPNISPRIRALDTQPALRQFWNEIRQQGTPLFEPLPDDPKSELVTFLWQAKFETHNVLVLWNPYATGHPEDFRMRRLRDSDLWYKTLRLPKGARFLYQLSPNDTLSRSPNAQRYATAQFDPLNPKRTPADPNLTRYELFSIAESPQAKPQPWSDRRAWAPRGGLHHHQVRSEILGNARKVTVYTPPGYQTQTAAYPLLLLFDGETYQKDIDAPAILDNLQAEKRIPPMVALLVHPATPDVRGDELFGNRKYADFIAQELLPWAAREYRISTDPGRNIIGGLSAGGFAAAFVALRHPEKFGNVISQSGAFWWAPREGQGEERNWLAREYISAPKRNLRFFLEAGLFENDIHGTGGQILEHNRHLRDVLRAKGNEVFYQEFPGGHDRINWRGSLPEALLQLTGYDRSHAPGDIR